MLCAAEPAPGVAVIHGAWATIALIGVSAGPSWPALRVHAGRDGAWVAFASWAALFAAMLALLAGFPRSHVAPGQRSA